MARAARMFAPIMVPASISTFTTKIPAVTITVTLNKALEVWVSD